MSSSTNYFRHSSSIVEEGAMIGDNCKIWHFSHIMKAVMGENCIIGQNVFIANNVKLGSNVKVQNNVSLYEGVECEDDVFIGPSVVFTNVINPRSFIERKNEFRKTIVKRGATLGANSTIVCGVTIGEYSLVGAGAVVTKDIKDFALVTGNPAVQSGWVSKHGLRLEFDDEGISVCPSSGAKYKLSDGTLSAI